MLQIKDLAYEIGGRILFTAINIHINPGQKRALIGPNGAGKTTLMKIINGELDDYRGSLSMPRHYRIGYLPQEEVSIAGKTVLETVMKGVEEIQSIQNQLQEVHRKWTRTGKDNNRLRAEAEELEQRLQSLDGYTLENRSEKILSGLGFSRKDMKRELAEFSGGWKMRVYLARILIQNPDLLLLDEPTNHLDLASLEWFEKFLKWFKGSVLLISHDRFFINRIADGIYELDNSTLSFYSGNYQFYEAEKEKNDLLSLKRWKEYQEKKEKLERFVDRFRYKASKASQAQERLKQLNKLEKVEVIGSRKNPDFTIGIEKQSFNDVLNIQDLSFAYDRDWVFEHLNLKVFRDEKIALIGKNGSGKTTLTRLITGQLNPRRGQIGLGENVTMDYYAQHQIDNLNLNSTVFNEIGSSVSSARFPQIRNILGIFGLSGEDIHKHIRVLSGGEKARLSLAKILISSANFLIMDEPLNHLDKQARHALERALIAYEGTLVLISHDRYFLDKIVTRVVEIKDGNIEDYCGNYSYYLEKRDKVENSPDSTSGNSRVEISRKDRKKREAEQRQQISGERKRLSALIEETEKRIDELEKQKAGIEKIMSDSQTYEDKKKVVRLQKELAEINRELALLYTQWEQSESALARLLKPVKTQKDR
jgi:ATP-binding cassette subfamily F protein 3